jgi:hypothetical protein
MNERRLDSELRIANEHIARQREAVAQLQDSAARLAAEAERLEQMLADEVRDNISLRERHCTQAAADNERELAALRAAVRWIFDPHGQLRFKVVDGFPVVESEGKILWAVTEHADALRKAIE